MVKLRLNSVLDAERQAKALGSASTSALRDTALKWLLERELKLLTFEDGVAEVIERITNLPR